MASRTNRRKTAEDPGTPDEWRRFAIAGGLLVLVVAMLLVGAVLQRGPEEAGAGSGIETVRIERSPEEAPVDPRLASVPAEPLDAPTQGPDESTVPVATSPVPAGGGGTGLGDRARRDTRRLGADADAWTLQLLVACDADNAERRVREAGGDSDLYVLPRLLDGRSCYRLCWGSFATRDAALAAADLPPTLRASLEEPPQPRRVADLLP